jgi:hypothetical protein
MNLKIIINSLLLIVVLHLFLQNIEYSVNIGITKLNENFENTNVEDPRNNLLKYLDDNDSPSASNSNLEKNNIPNFGNENSDISKFFKIYDNLDETDLKKSKNEFETGQHYLEQTNSLEQHWKYNNELPMNGGPMNSGSMNTDHMNGGLMSDSIVGFDSLDGNYASFNFNDDIGKKEEINDLRNGMNM